MKRIAGTFGAVLPVLGLCLGVGFARGEDLKEIVVESSPPHVVRLPGDTAGSTAGENKHVDLISVRYGVKYSDLDLSTHSGATTLEQRIDAAAHKGCEQIERQHPLARPAADDKPCVKTAVDNAMVFARQAIAAAEAKRP